jgi:hypothetical protein
MAREDREARLTASAPTRDGGRLYLSSALTPYGVESFCDQIASLGCRFSGEVHVSVDVDGLQRGCPELRALTCRVKRLRRQGVVVHFHTARLRRSVLHSVKVDRLALAR